MENARTLMEGERRMLRITAFLLLLVACGIHLAASAAAQSLEFISSTGGTAVSTYYYPQSVYLRYTDASAAGSGTVTAEIIVEHGSIQRDQETVTLTETAGGVFEGPPSGEPTAFTSPPSFGNGILEGFNFDTLHAIKGTLSAYADLQKPEAASTTALVDATGAEVSFYEIGDTVFVRVSDDDENDAPDAADVITVTLSTSNGDRETLTLVETGDDTGVFEGAIGSTLATTGVALYDGILQVTSGNILTVSYTDATDSGDTSSDTANFIGETSSNTCFTDSTGSDRSSYRAGGEGIYVTVYDADQNTDDSTQQSLVCTVSDGATGDTVTITLYETTNNSGVFRNPAPGLQSEIGLATAADGVLQTEVGSTVQVTYTDPRHSTDTSSDTAVMTADPSASATRFTDSAGNDVYNIALNVDYIYVTVDDADENTSASTSQSITVVVSSTITGDNETLTLVETSADSGVFRNTTGLETWKPTPYSATPNDGVLESWPGDTITVTYTDYDDAGDVSSDTASANYWTLSSTTISLTTGIPPVHEDQVTILYDDIYVIVDDDDENTDWSAAETVYVTVTVASTGDTEMVTLTETGPDTGFFTNASLPLLSAVMTPVTSNDTVLETTDGSTFTASYVDDDDPTDVSSDTSTLVASPTAGVAEFTDSWGTPVTSYTVGVDGVYVDVFDPDRNSDAATAQQIVVEVDSNSTGDVEYITLVETGSDTGEFINTSPLPLAIATRNDGDGTLAVSDGSLIVAKYLDSAHGDTSSDLATVNVLQTTSTVRFTDSTGTLKPTFRIGTEYIFVTVQDPDENTNASTSESIIVSVRNDVNGDTETLTLVETETNSGIFRNTVGLQTSLDSGASTTGDGILEGMDLDSITAVYRDNDTPSDLSYAYATLEYYTSAQIKFTDATGGPIVSEYAIGDTSAPIYIQVVDPDENLDPNAPDLIEVELYDLRTGGDRFTIAGGNSIILTETTSNSGIFRNTTGVLSEVEPVDVTDDVLQTIGGATIEARYTDPNDSGDQVSATARMTMLQTGAIIYFADSFATPVSSYTIQADQVYVVVDDQDQDTNPAVVESLQATIVDTTTGDSETVTLVEDDPHSGIFIGGPISSNTQRPTAGDGILEVAHWSWLRFHYQDPDDTTDYSDDYAQMQPSDLTDPAVQFTDAAGSPVSTYVIGIDPVYVTVTDPDMNADGSVRDAIIATVSADTGDVVSNVVLTETDVDSGVFRNTAGIPLEFNGTPFPDDTLQVNDPSTLTADYTAALDGESSSAAATAVRTPTSSYTRFTDASSTVRTTFTIGAGDIYITVWDDDPNSDTNTAESVTVTVVSTLTGDTETVTLTETGPNTGQFRNTTGLSSDRAAPIPGDGVLQVSADETIVVTYTDPTDPSDVSTHAAVMSMPSIALTTIEFISAPGGTPVTWYYIYDQAIHIRVADQDQDRSALTTDSIEVTLSCTSTGDTIILTLSETGVNTGVFENTTGVPSVVGVADTTDTTLQVRAPDIVTVTYTDPCSAGDTGSVTAAMRMTESASWIAFTDQGGTTKTTYWIDPLAPPSLGNGELIYVTLYDRDENHDPSAAESVIVTLESAITGDVVTSVTLVETGDSTCLFRNVIGVDSEVAAAVTSDGILQTADGATITVTYTDADSAADSSNATAVMRVRPAGAVVQFTNASGASTTSYYIAVDDVYVTLYDSDQNTDPTTRDSVVVTLSTSLTGDVESLVLTETTSSSGVFRNTTGLSSTVSLAATGDGVLQTRDSDTVTVSYVDPDDAGDVANDTAIMHNPPSASTIHFITAPGAPPAPVATLHTISWDLLLVEVYDPDENTDPASIQTVTVTLTTTDTPDPEQETMILYETGNNTGYFQTTLADGIYSDIALPVQEDGTFQTVYPSTIIARYIDDDYIADQSTATIPTTMPTASAAVAFTDSTGTAITTYSIGLDEIYVTVTDPNHDTDYSTPQSIVVTLSDLSTGDTMTVTLVEISNNVGIFRNFLSGIRSEVATAVTTDDVLQTSDGATIVVTYVDEWDSSDTVSTTATMRITPSTAAIRFTDSGWTTRTWYTINLDGIYVEVIDADENRDPSVRESIVCTVSDDRTPADTESITLLETTSSSGIFRSTTALQSEAAVANPGDGVLQTHGGATITVTYLDPDDATDLATSTARTFIASSNSTVRFTDGGGIDQYYYDFGVDQIYVTVDDYDEDTDSLTIESVQVTVRVTANGDEEVLTLVEQVPNSGGTFINTSGLPTAVRTTATPHNGVLEAMEGDFLSVEYRDDDNPPSNPDLDVSTDDAMARMPQTASTVRFTDASGNDVSSYLTGRAEIYVTVWDPDQDVNPEAADTVTVRIDTNAPLFDTIQALTLTETGVNSGVFRNTAPLRSEYASSATTTDLNVQVNEETAGAGYDTVTVTYTDPTDGTDTSTDTVDITTRTTAVVEFTDASGTAVSTYVIGVDYIYVTVRDPDENENTSSRERILVTITADATGDVETRYLLETGVDTGVFRNSIPVSSVYQNSPTSGNGLVETIASASGAPYTLTVTYTDNDYAPDTVSDSVDVVPQDPDDRDGDGIPNSVETSYGLDPDDPSDARMDLDGDGRSNIAEYLEGTNLNDPSDNLPVADPGPAQTVDPSYVTLDGSASYDASTHPPTGIILYQWSLLAGPVEVTLDDPNAATTHFVGREAGTYTFELRVTDKDYAESSNTVSITINDVAPDAMTVPGASVYVGSDTILHGAASRDANTTDPTVLGYTWTQTAGPAETINNANARTADFNPLTAGIHVFNLDVSDSVPNVGSARVEVWVHSTSNHIPFADAGPDKMAMAGETVTLDGRSSADHDGDILAYQWSFVSGPSPVTISSASSALATFTAPSAAGIYRFRLRVSDGLLQSEDYVDVVVNTNTDHVPAADAGGSGGLIPLPVLTTATIPGSGSDEDGQPLTYRWVQTNGEHTPLSDPTTATPSFTPITPGIYTWELSVTDSANLTSPPDTISYYVYAADDHPPTANAGVDATVLLQDDTTSPTGKSVVVQLDGSLSNDTDGDTLEYFWRQTAGANAPLSNWRVVSPTFTARVPGVYRFELRVFDGKYLSHPDSVEITVVGDNQPPVADAGDDQSVITTGSPVLVTLDGTGSYDPDGVPSPLTYHWEQVANGAPAVSLVNADTATPYFVTATAGDYEFRLTVSDGELSDTDTVVIHVSKGNTVPVAVADYYCGTPGQKTVYVGQLVTLDGTGSYDPDGDSFSYYWQQIISASTPQNVVLNNPTLARPTFIPYVAGVYQFRLTVTGDDGSSTAEVAVYVYGNASDPGGNPPPGGDEVFTSGGGGGCDIGGRTPSNPTAILLIMLAPVVLLLTRKRMLGRGNDSALQPEPVAIERESRVGSGDGRGKRWP